jgi:acylphosphatase
MTKEVHIIVSGRVQLVMYRDFTQRKARKHGLVGTVQNLADGTVEVFAQGSEDKLDSFINELKKGSVLSRVDDVTIEPMDNLGTYKGFSIIF